MKLRPQVAQNAGAVDPFRNLSVRGRVVAIVEEGAADHLEILSRRYLGKPYRWWHPNKVRQILMILIERLRARPESAMSSARFGKSINTKHVWSSRWYRSPATRRGHTPLRKPRPRLA